MLMPLCDFVCVFLNRQNSEGQNSSLIRQFFLTSWWIFCFNKSKTASLYWGEGFQEKSEGADSQQFRSTHGLKMGAKTEAVFFKHHLGNMA